MRLIDNTDSNIGNPNNMCLWNLTDNYGCSVSDDRINNFCKFLEDSNLAGLHVVCPSAVKLEIYPIIDLVKELK